MHKREDDEDKWMTMRRYVEWSAEIMRIQNNQSMYFIYAHPAGAKSWDLGCMRRLSRCRDVRTVVGGGVRWMTNSEEMEDVVVRMLEVEGR